MSAKAEEEDIIVYLLLYNENSVFLFHRKQIK